MTWIIWALRQQVLVLEDSSKCLGAWVGDRGGRTLSPPRCTVDRKDLTSSGVGLSGFWLFALIFWFLFCWSIRKAEQFSLSPCLWPQSLLRACWPGGGRREAAWAGHSLCCRLAWQCWLAAWAWAGGQSLYCRCLGSHRWAPRGSRKEDTDLTPCMWL